MAWPGLMATQLECEYFVDTGTQFVLSIFGRHFALLARRSFANDNRFYAGAMSAAASQKVRRLIDLCQRASKLSCCGVSTAVST